ncbi:hypothetical protein [uncultured Flavobacterium sp.]|uniref:hypothetical protein n=1 Tax=uncultured Flavobacterium sp. TaxID=165435 RepID=UPI0025DEDB60|nr:hypothetical protein [uncultured Flavobacterium sp.]
MKKPKAQQPAKVRLTYLWISSCLFLTFTAHAQEAPTTPIAPTPVEVNAGNNRFGVQFLITKHFSPQSKLNFFSITSFESDYDNNPENFDFITNTQAGYEFLKHLSAVAGLSVNSKAGLTPTVGLKYLFTNREILFVLTPTYSLTETKNLQGVLLLEYRPALTKTLSLYSRLQSMYIYDTQNSQHQRSYYQLRLGTGIEKYQFGFAANLDYYGKAKILKENYGVFLKVNFQ